MVDHRQASYLRVVVPRTGKQIASLGYDFVGELKYGIQKVVNQNVQENV
jgi:hypothetical protein